MLETGDADVRRSEQDVEPRPGRPAIDRRDDRLPHSRVVVAHPPVDTALLAVHGAGKRPVDALGAQIFAVIGGEFGARRKIVPAAKMPVAGTRQDRAADVAILPEVDPGLRNLVRCRLVENVRLGGVVERDVRNPIALLIIDRQTGLPVFDMHPGGDIITVWFDPAICAGRFRQWANTSKDWRSLSCRRDGRIFPSRCGSTRSWCFWTRWG